jgi:CheY-like chemotaxis protein
LLARIERVDASSTLPPGLKSSLALQAAGYGPQTAPVNPRAAANLTVPPGTMSAPTPGFEALMVQMEGIRNDLAALMQRHQDLSVAVARLAAFPGPPTPASGPAVSTAEPLAPKPSQISSRVVLIVENDAALAERIRVACVELGLDPVVFADAGAALESLSRERPALVIVEPLLPGEPSGLDLVNQVKATIEWIAIPILVHTRAEIANHEQARNDFGADDYVLKAEGSVETLARKVARLIG